MNTDEIRAADRAAVAACFTNADELLRGARSLSAADMPRLAYHLAVLALEEVGKARILKMKIVSDRQGRELPPSIARALDDHVRKLFWAIWGQTMGQELVTGEQITSNIGLAQRLHERRVAGLYVDRTDDGVSLPMGTITRRDRASNRLRCHVDRNGADAG
jgi:AbiV family abortive infection protein